MFKPLTTDKSRVGVLFFRRGGVNPEAKSSSGRYILLYKHRGSLYTNMTLTLIYLVAICNIEVKEMTTTITQQQVDNHNRVVIARTVAQHIWAQTSRMDTPTRHSTWSR